MAGIIPIIQCGILDSLEPGDAVMADKGFNVAESSVTLNIPPKKNDSQLSNSESNWNQKDCCIDDPCRESVSKSESI